MIKLVISIVAAVVLGMTMLQLRQQHLDLSHECDSLHNQIQAHQTKLWDQQLQIATMTGPTAIEKTITDENLKLVPRSTTQPAESAVY